MRQARLDRTLFGREETNAWDNEAFNAVEWDNV